MTLSPATEQTEWLRLVDTSGPFLGAATLAATFPQGLEEIETPRRQRLRSAYDEWRQAVDDSDPQLDDIHRAWVRMVFLEGLEYDDGLLYSGHDLPSFTAEFQGQDYTPDFGLHSGDGPFLLLITVHPPEVRLDQPLSADWATSPIERMTEFCRAGDVRVGLVTNGEEWALVNAPVDGTTGHTTWYGRIWWQEPVTFKAFVSLLGVRRFFGPESARVDRLLEQSLQEQHAVTVTLGEQVRRAVEVLVQSVGRIDDDRGGVLLRNIAASELYRAGLTVMMRLVFLLAAEERDMLLLGDPVYDQHYAVSTLRAKLDDDADQHGDEVLERRFDAWSRLLTMFRAVYAGIEHESLRLPAMGGDLFDPDRFPFLEGRGNGTSWSGEPEHPPLRIDNRTVLLLLRALQVLGHREGARQLSYRGLDVEQLGHVYEGLLEFEVSRVTVPTLGLIGSKKVPQPSVGLGDVEAALRAGHRKASSDLARLTGRSRTTIARALERRPDPADLSALVEACGGDENLARRIEPFARLLRTDTWGAPLVYRAGSFAIVPGAGRRQSGTQNTPRALTQPVVRMALRPLFEEMGTAPTPDQLLALRICDPAMGSGAFLVEACRQLGGHLVEAWSRAEGAGSFVAADGSIVAESSGAELLSSAPAERLVVARRLVAERCLYGVDKNPMAADLAKLSLWLVTLSKGRPFGFLDHRLRHGDSLVGLSRDQIATATWGSVYGEPGKRGRALGGDLIAAARHRRRIADLGEHAFDEKAHAQCLAEAVTAVGRQRGDLVIAAFFGATKDNDRRDLLEQYLALLAEAERAGTPDPTLVAITQALRDHERPIPPFHWELEFPEVFDREAGGFDAIVGNPPFAYKNTFAAAHRPGYLDWLKSAHQGTHGNSDLVAHFFRRGFTLLRNGGTMGSIATKTIRQGATRTTGLQWICTHDGSVYFANRRLAWPGAAAVIVSLVGIHRGEYSGTCILDGEQVPKITAFLFHSGGHLTPTALKANAGISYIGALVYGPGFTFDDHDNSGLASPLAERSRLIRRDPRNAERIFPYMDGSSINSSPSLAAPRFVINFDQISEEAARQWPDLFEIVDARVRPAREKLTGTDSTARRRRKFWWQWGGYPPSLFEATRGLDEVLVHSLVTRHWCLAFVPAQVVLANTVNVVVRATKSSFATLQSRVHEVWARFFGSSMKDDFRYTINTCSKPFPFCPQWDRDPILGKLGASYYEFRGRAMLENGEGMTKTYNRFHDPHEHSDTVRELRKLHEGLDRAVLAAYGWSDIPTDADFFEDYDAGEGKKTAWRYRWPDAVENQVLERLLALHEHQIETETGESVRARSR